MKKVILSLVISITVLSAYSQVNLQVYGSYVRNLNPDFKGKAYGTGLRLEFGEEESSLSYYAGLHYTAPISTKHEVEARAYSSATEPSYVPVTALYKLPIYRLEGGMRYYFAGEPTAYDRFNFYANLGVEVSAVPNKPTYSYFDRELYTLGWSADSDVNEEGSEKLGLNFNLAAGAGIEKNLGPGNLFLHITIAIPAFASGDDGSDIASFTPLPAGLNLGYKIPLSRK
jgi:hypothetical protein